jgi:hypothetical protein
MDIEEEYEGKVVLVTGGAKVFFQTLRTFNHQTFKKGLIQTLFFYKETFTKERNKRNKNKKGVELILR